MGEYYENMTEAQSWAELDARLARALNVIRLAEVVVDRYGGDTRDVAALSNYADLVITEFLEVLVALRPEVDQ